MHGYGTDSCNPLGTAVKPWLQRCEPLGYYETSRDCRVAIERRQLGAAALESVGLKLVTSVPSE
jgi:hypothetical protein